MEMPCWNCEIRKWYVRRLDAHFFGEDCPYVCERYERWKDEREEDHGLDDSADAGKEAGR